MKTKLTTLAGILLAGLLIVGCTALNPHAGQPVVDSSGNPVLDPSGSPVIEPTYVPDPRIDQYHGIVRTAIGVIPPNPYTSLISAGADAGILLVGGVSAWLATRRKSKQQIDALAAGVVKAGPVAAQAVLNHAATTDHFAPIAKAINDNTGANQTSTGG